MTAPFQPASVETNGTVRMAYLTAVANKLQPKLTELNAVSSLDISCWVTGDGLNTDTSENSIEDPRLCSKQVFQSPGDFSQTLELTYVFNPKVPADDKARTTLLRGVKGFIVIRWAVDVEAPWAVGDIVDVYPVTMGKQRKQTPGRNSVHKIMQKPYVTGTVAEDVLVVA